MKKIFHWIDRGLAKIALFFIVIYQKTLSPDKGILSIRLKGRVCAHEPHCSEYGKQCFQYYGFFTGLYYTLSRVSSCVPSYQKQYDPHKYSVVFFSGAPIGVPFLEALIQDKRFDVTGVVTMPDAARGRGMKVKENIIKLKAKSLNLKVETPRSLRLNSPKYTDEAKEFLQRLKNKQPDFIVVVAYGKIIPQEILQIPRIGPINVHGSLLPKYRGASPLQSVFLHNELETGVTIMHMSAGLDEGDIIDQLPIQLTFTMTVNDLITVFQEQGPKFLVKTLWKYGKGDIISFSQDETQVTMTHKLHKEQALIDISKDTIECIYTKYKAYALRPKIYFIHAEKRVIIEEMIVDKAEYNDLLESPLWGHFNNMREGGKTLHPAVQKLIVKPEGKKSMSREAFVRGNLKNHKELLKKREI